MVLKISIACLLLIGVTFGARIPTADRNEASMHPKFDDDSEPRIGKEQLKLEATHDYWLNEAQKFIAEQNKKTLNTNVARNIIFFMGDGMSMPTLAATRVHLGGEERTFSFEKFPSTGMSKTYCVDYQVTDSATSATAYLNGVKGNMGTIGVGGWVKYGNCADSENVAEYTTSIAKWAMDAGKSAGLVTTTRVTHASPAGVYAHTADRDWEADSDVKRAGCDPNKVHDIARQLIEGDTGSRLQVILGGGRQGFRGKHFADEVNGYGKRLDGRDMIDEWMKKQNQGEKREYVWNTTSLNSIDASKTTHLLGLFDRSHMKYRREVVEKKLEEQQPSLTEMVAKAIQVLEKNKNGYFLFVEGGRIDHAHHSTLATTAIEETVELSKAIEYAHRTVNNSETTILVTADHSHTMSYAGYPDRGNTVSGTGDISKSDNMTFYTLSYANGIGYDTHTKETGGRVDPKDLNHEQIFFRYPATVPMQFDAETHGGDDVAVYTSGPWSHLFTGTFEQNAIPEMLAYAACIGDGLKACDKH